MNTTIMQARKPRALLAALALTLALATPALGVTSTTSETLTVDAQITLTGVPATLDYGNHLAGGLAAPMRFPVTVSGNSPWTLTLAMSDLVSGDDVIPSTARKIDNASSAPVAGVTFTAPYADTEGSAPYPGPADSPVEIMSASEPAEATLGVGVHVAIPATAAAGVYSGTLTFTATATP